MNGYARCVPEGGIELIRMRWWHVEPVLRLEHELFPEETWSAAAFWNELAEIDTRHYVVALLDGEVVGYAGLATFGDEAHVLTIGVTGTVQRGGIGTALLRDLLGRGRTAPGAARRSGRQRRRPAAVRAARVRPDRPAPPLLPAQRHRRPRHGPRTCPPGSGNLTAGIPTGPRS